MDQRILVGIGIPGVDGRGFENGIECVRPRDKDAAECIYDEMI